MSMTTKTRFNNQKRLLRKKSINFATFETKFFSSVKTQLELVQKRLTVLNS